LFERVESSAESVGELLREASADDQSPVRASARSEQENIRRGSPIL